MKKFSLFSVAAALALVVSCQKPQSEADRNAQIEREVQQRLAAERQADEQKRLAQQQADLDAREKALANRDAATVAVAENPAVATTAGTVTEAEEESDSESTTATSSGPEA